MLPAAAAAGDRADVLADLRAWDGMEMVKGPLCDNKESKSLLASAWREAVCPGTWPDLMMSMMVRHKRVVTCRGWM